MTCIEKPPSRFFVTHQDQSYELTFGSECHDLEGFTMWMALRMSTAMLDAASIYLLSVIAHSRHADQADSNKQTQKYISVSIIRTCSTAHD